MKEREHTVYHERTIDQQTLDALLRIEELLTEMKVTYIRSLPVATPPFGGEVVEKPAVETEEVFDPDGHKVGTVRKAKRK